MTKAERNRKNILFVLQKYGVIEDDYSVPQVANSEYVSNGVWGLLNKALYINRTDNKALSEIFYIRASQTFKEGKNPYVELYLAGQHLIKSYDDLTFKVSVTIITSKYGSCRNCQHLGGMIMNIEDAKRLNLIPHNPCSKGYCSAAYAAMPLRDKDGFVIMK